jgi:hypothetical protein
MNKQLSFKTALAIVVFVSVSVSCTELKPLSDILIPPAGGNPSLTNDEVIAGLREALIQGAQTAGNKASSTDGFYKNPLLFIPFPEEAIKVKNTAVQYGFEGKVVDFEMTMNRAAESASKEAREVFVQAISGLSVQDGFAILRGNNNAATVYLRNSTEAELRTRFSPKVRTAINAVQLTSYWEPLVNIYNTYNLFSGGQAVNPDLEAYITDRAIRGLFVHIEAEELLIRQDPQARATELLRRVFGSL